MGDIINKSFFQDIRTILQQARQKAYVAVNFAMVGAYWQIGKRIIEEEQAGKHRADYRSFLITRLSKELTIEFGKGFSVANLKNFRQFYLTFPDFEKGYTVCSQLSWSHYRLIMRVESQKARNYYLTEACEQHWSTRQLQRNINSYYYERLLGSADKKTVSINNKAVAGEFIKDPYVLEFLNLQENKKHSEKKIETAIINHLQNFLLEMGKGFSFVGRQFRISTETTHFYIDLVFYLVILHCYVVVEQKAVKFKPEFAGKLNFYVSAVDGILKSEHDNTTIGILICKSKSDMVVEYALKDVHKPIGVSEYIITKNLPDEFRSSLPGTKEVEAELSGAEELQ